MKRLLVSLLVLAATTPLFASARLTYMIGGKPTPISWNVGGFPIAYSIDPRILSHSGSQEAINKAFDSWAAVPDTAVQFRYAGPQQANAGKDQRNVVTVGDSLFTNSGFIAYTTNWFDDNGTTYESDIELDARAFSDNYDIAALVQHEVGHFLGLDHSAVLTSVMYPFVLPDRAADLDSDDRLAVATMYPKTGGTAGSIRGDIRDASGPIFGAQVVAVSSGGAPVATALSDANGHYSLAVPKGTYKVYVEPLDGPVNVANLSGVWRDSRSTAFRTRFADGDVVVNASLPVEKTIQLDGPPATLNIRWIGAFPANSDQVQLSTTASRVYAGTTVNIGVGGDGIVGGMTTFEVSNPGFQRTSDFHYGSNYVWATFAIQPTTAPGSLVVVAHSGDETSALTGGIEVTKTVRRRAVR